MFEAILPQGVVLKKIIDAIKELVTEVNFEVTPEGLSVQAMDASHVALVVLTLDAENFEDFRCDRPQTLGISITNLAKLLKIAGNEDEITLRAEDEASHLTLVFKGKRDEKISEFNLNLLTLDSEHLGIPEEEHCAEVVMASAEFSRICRELTQVTDTLNIGVDKEALKLAVSGDLGAGSITIRANDSDKAEEKLLLRASEPISMAFALRYLNLFNKAASLSEEVQICMSPEVPIVMKFAFDLGSLKYYLAPKISEDS